MSVGGKLLHTHEIMGAQKSKLCENDGENYNVQRRQHQNLQDQSHEQRRKRRKWRKKQGYSLPTGLDTVGKTNNNINHLGISAASSHADIPDLDQDDAILVSYSQSNAEKFSHLRPLFANNANKTALQRRASSEEPNVGSTTTTMKENSSSPLFSLKLKDQDHDNTNIVVDHVQVIRVNSSDDDDDEKIHQSINFTKKDPVKINNINPDRIRDTDVPNHNKTVVAINVNKSSTNAEKAEPVMIAQDDDEISSINHVKNHQVVAEENLKKRNRQDVVHEQEAHAILNVIELDSFKQISGIPSPKLDQEDIDLLNALMNNDNITLVKEPSFVIQEPKFRAKVTKNSNSSIQLYETEKTRETDHDRDLELDRPDDETTCTTTAVAPPSPFTNVEQIEENQKQKCGSSSHKESIKVEQKDGNNISSSSSSAADQKFRETDNVIRQTNHYPNNSNSRISYNATEKNKKFREIADWNISSSSLADDHTSLESPPAVSPISITNEDLLEEKEKQEGKNPNGQSSSATAEDEKEKVKLLRENENSKFQKVILAAPDKEEIIKPKLRDLDESANIIDDLEDDDEDVEHLDLEEEEEPEVDARGHQGHHAHGLLHHHPMTYRTNMVRPSIDCDVLNSVIVEENENEFDIQSVTSCCSSEQINNNDETVDVTTTKNTNSNIQILDDEHSEKTRETEDPLDKIHDFDDTTNILESCSSTNDHSLPYKDEYVGGGSTETKVYDDQNKYKEIPHEKKLEKENYDFEIIYSDAEESRRSQEAQKMAQEPKFRETATKSSIANIQIFEPEKTREPDTTYHPDNKPLVVKNPAIDLIEASSIKKDEMNNDNLKFRETAVIKNPKNLNSSSIISTAPADEKNEKFRETIGSRSAGPTKNPNSISRNITPTTEKNEKFREIPNSGVGNDENINTNVGKETDVDSEDPSVNDDDNDSENFREINFTEKLYHSKLVTCVDDSDEDIDYRVSHMDDEELAYDLKVPNESWSTEFKSNLNYRPRPLGCSSDSPDSCTSSGLDNKEHYDSLEEEEQPDPEPVNVMVRHPFPAEIVVVPQSKSQHNSKQKRSLPPIPKDHSLQQQRAYEILRQQWQCTPSSTNGNGSDSLDEDLYPEVHDQSSRPHVEGRSADFSDYDLLLDDHNNQNNFNVNLTSKRQLPKPPPVSPIVLLNEDPTVETADGDHALGQQGGQHAHGQLHPMTTYHHNPVHQELEHLQQADSGCASLNFNTEHDHHSLQLDVEELLPGDGGEHCGDDEKTCEIDEISRSRRRKSSSSNNNNEKRNQQVQVQKLVKSEVEKVEKENLELLQTSRRHRNNNNHLEHPSTNSTSQWAKNP